MQIIIRNLCIKNRILNLHMSQKSSNFATDYRNYELKITNYEKQTIYRPCSLVLHDGLHGTDN